jgi:hypothetical protein
VQQAQSDNPEKRLGPVAWQVHGAATASSQSLKVLAAPAAAAAYVHELNKYRHNIKKKSH